MDFEINKEIEKLSCKMHRRTGYSIRHAVLEMRDNAEVNPFFFRTGSLESRQGAADFATFNSETWSWFLEFINEACK